MRIYSNLWAHIVNHIFGDLLRRAILSLFLGVLVFPSYSSPFRSDDPSFGDSGVWTNLDYYDGPLDNPGIGFVDFHDSYYQQVSVELRYYEPKVLYYRWAWADMEPEEGVFDFSRLDAAIARAKRENKTVGFRIMPVWQSSSPEWLNEKGVAFVDVNDGHGSKFPDHNAPNFIKYHFNFLEALSKHINKEKYIEFIDIGSVGCWGEWHASCCKTEESKRICSDYFPSYENQVLILKEYAKLFSYTRLIGLIAAPTEQFSKLNIGWRADCLGDMGFFSKKSNHMRDVYEPIAARDNMKDIWLKAPVAFETCFTLQSWLGKGFDIDYIFNQALNWHLSTLNNINQSVPGDILDKVEKFRAKMGYRIFVKSYFFPKRVSSIDGAVLCIDFSNLGVAPPYREIFSKLRFTNAMNHLTATVDFPFDSARLLPGETFGCKYIRGLVGMAPGKFYIDFAMKTGLTADNDIALANISSVGDGWYRLGSFELN